MRLLRLHASSGQLSLTRDLIDSDITQRYAILSHTWAINNDDEVTFQDMNDGSGIHKPGYTKILFCADMTRQHGLEYFWVDSCCIDKTNSVELSTAIVSMFDWYAKSERCFVYLEDVSMTRKYTHDQNALSWKSEFRKSRWFTRGWTLQELLAPQSVEFFSREGELLGKKATLASEVHEITGVPYAALADSNLDFKRFPIKERLQWAQGRVTKRREDKAYCLLGILGVSIYFTYGEGENTWRRLMRELDDDSRLDRSEHQGSQELAMAVKFQEQLIASLDHGSPFTRSNNIKPPSDETFAWIFDNKLLDPRDFDSEQCTVAAKRFLDWLEQGDGIFLFRGKPGSGKSTLMKFLVGNDREVNVLYHLKAWAATHNNINAVPQTPTHYFWLGDPTTPTLQNSFRGFACSILCQLLQTASPEFIVRMMESDQLKAYQKRTIANWDEEELERWLQLTVSEISRQTSLCFFVDGLDECIETDLERVVDMIKMLMGYTNVKFCISSREETSVNAALRSNQII
ncbi:heterokaryon incompatibility protein-domain-containing protein [Xylaria arbuscula]|nr:heterokaryon incompatibility protein-domain-containing protein [Xylaria arbuscula]